MSTQLVRKPKLVFLDKKSEKIDVLGSPLTREKLLMYSLLKFYKKPDTLTKIIPIIERKSCISLRIIDWFINQYSKNNSVVFPVYNKKTGKIKGHVYIYESYKNTLRSFHGEHFEIYKRSDIVVLKYGKKQLQTTVAQLNFFKWALTNHVITYIQENFNMLGSKLYISDRKYTNNRLPTKISKDENGNVVQVIVEWNHCESKKSK